MSDAFIITFGYKLGAYMWPKDRPITPLMGTLFGRGLNMGPPVKMPQNAFFKWLFYNLGHN